MSTHYLYIGQSGDAVLVDRGDMPSLEALQTIVGGLIQSVSPNKIDPCVDVWVNEEGLFMPEFGINLVASYMSGRQLVGPAVITGFRPDGATIGVPDAVIKNLKRDGLMIADKIMSPTQVRDTFWPTNVVRDEQSEPV